MYEIKNIFVPYWTSPVKRHIWTSLHKKSSSRGEGVRICVTFSCFQMSCCCHVSPYNGKLSSSFILNRAMDGFSWSCMCCHQWWSWWSNIASVLGKVRYPILDINLSKKVFTFKEYFSGQKTNLFFGSRIWSDCHVYRTSKWQLFLSKDNVW